MFSPSSANAPIQQSLAELILKYQGLARQGSGKLGLLGPPVLDR